MKRPISSLGKAVLGIIGLSTMVACSTIPPTMERSQQILDNLPGKVMEVKREKRLGVDTEKMTLMPQVSEEKGEPEDVSEEVVPEIASLKGSVELELFDLSTSRYFSYVVSLAELAKFSREKSRLPDESNPAGKRVSTKERRLEDSVKKSWSNATDNRTRRAIADGYSDTNSIYQRIADFGGCSANVLSANSSRMIAITAAHCVLIAGNNFTSSKLRPRRNGGTSPTWGSWTPYSFAYYSSFLNENCDDNWKSKCIRRDIALVFASPDSDATPPQGMGWGYRPKSFLDDHSKYRRGYPGCNNGHSPSGCTTNNLYGDGSLSVGSFSKKQNGWNRQFRFSSDVNPGDSGSGLYYYRNGFPYVFGVTSAEPSGCKTSCSSSRPNYGRRITPDFFDFINSVM